MIGTIVWKWQDDNGMVHKFIIPKSFYVKESHVQLLSPQHWAQTQKDAKSQQGTGSETVGDRVTLFWKQCKHQLTIPLNQYNNFATFNLAPGYTKFMSFCTESKVDYAAEQLNPIICFPAHLVSDNEADSDSTNNYEQPASADTGLVEDNWATPS
jgi:hypothetical protein